MCQRLLPCKEVTADSLLRSLHLLLRLGEATAWDLAPAIAAEVGLCICFLEYILYDGSSAPSFF